AKRRATNFALDDLGIVVGPAHRAEDEVENVLFLRRGSLGFRLEFRRASRTFRVSCTDESAAIRADEQEAAFALLEDTVRSAVPQLFRMAETRLEQFERLFPVEPEGSAEPDDGLVNHEGPAVPALRLVWRDGLLADGTKNPGLFPGHRHRLRVVPSRINSPFPLSSPIPGRTRAQVSPLAWSACDGVERRFPRRFPPGDSPGHRDPVDVPPPVRPAVRRPDTIRRPPGVREPGCGPRVRDHCERLRPVHPANRYRRGPRRGLGEFLVRGIVQARLAEP